MSALLALALAAAQPHQHDHSQHRPEPAADPHARHAEPEDPHAGHEMHEAPEPAADPHAHHAEPEDPHAGHEMHEAPSDPHAGHGAADPHAGHGAEMRNPPRPPVAPPPPGAVSGPAHAADMVFGAERMAPVRDHIRREHGAMPAYRFLVDELELKLGDHAGYGWDASFWYGGDIDKLWLKSSGEGAFGGGVEHAELQALWSRAVTPWFDLQTGIRQDLRRGPERTHAVLGVHGLAPYWFEVEAMLFVSHKGEVTARAEAEYDLRLTRRLVLQPMVEAEFSLQDVPELRLGSGLTGAEIGARLRYEIEPNFAPYIGLGYERAFGGTARYRRMAGDDAGGWSLLVGVRSWF